MLHLGTRRSFLMSVIALLVFGVGPAPRGQSTLATLTGTSRQDGSAAVIPRTPVSSRQTLATGLQRPGRHGSPQAGSLGPEPRPLERYAGNRQHPGISRTTCGGGAAGTASVRVDVRLPIAGAEEHMEVRGHRLLSRPIIDHRPFEVWRGHQQARAELSRHGQHQPDRRRHAGARRAAGSRRRDLDRRGLPFMTSFSVDGISTQRIRFGGPSRELFPSVESIEEFKVRSASNNAEFMQVTDITTTTRAAAISCTAPAFWFFQDSALSAATQFTPRDASGKAIKPEIAANSFGGSGRRSPHAKSRVLLRHVRRRAAAQRIDADPGRAAGRVAHRAISRAWRAAPQSVHRPAFPNNQIPVNPVAARMLDSFYERQNQPTGAAIDRPELHRNAPGDFTVNGFDARGDYALSADAADVRPLHGKERRERAARPASWNTKQGDQFKRTEVRQLAGSHNCGLAGSLLNEIRGGWSNTAEKDSYANAARARDLIAGIGLLGLPARRQPAASRTSSSPTARSSRPAASSRSTF